MNRFLIVGSALTAVMAAGAASAADLSPIYKAPPAAAPVYDWAGFYVGANAGYAWGHSDVSSNIICAGVPGTCLYNLPVNLAGISAAGTGTLSPSGFVGGIQAGYNWQSGKAVFGVEADIDAFGLAASQTVGGPVFQLGNPVPAAAFAVTTGVHTDWLATFRGRLGWTVMPTMLLYATGGVALTDLRVTNAFTDTISTLVPGAANTAAGSSATQTKVGWTVGGGLESALGRNWTVRGEYLYVNFGSVSTTATVVNPSVSPALAPNLLTTSANLSAHIARVGVNYRF